MSNQNPIIIIGSGMAGYTLARELRKLSPNIAITLVCRDAGESYAKPTLSNALAQGKLADTIALSDANKMAESLNLTVFNFYNVSHIDSDNKTITIHPVLASDKQEIMPYSKLVLATGANARTLPNITTDQEMVFSVNHLDDYRKFQQVFHSQFKEKLSQNQPFNLVIIGAGLIGCEFANDMLTHTNTLEEGLAKLENFNITLIDKAPYPMANQLPKIAGEALQNALQQSGADFILQSDILSVEKENSLSKITIKNANGDTQTLTADLVLVATGLVANTELAEQSGLKVAHLSPTVEMGKTHLPRTAQQGILVDEFLQTSIADSTMPDIYAIGDCANVMGSFMPYVMPLMNQAKTLAKTLADSFNNNCTDSNAPATPIKYPAMPVAIKTPACPLVILPVSGQFSDEQIDWENQATEDGMILLAKEKANSEHLLGFVLVGKEAGKQRMTLAKQVKDWI